MWTQCPRGACYAAVAANGMVQFRALSLKATVDAGEPDSNMSWP